MQHVILLYLSATCICTCKCMTVQYMYMYICCKMLGKSLQKMLEGQALNPAPFRSDASSCTCANCSVDKVDGEPTTFFHHQYSGCTCRWLTCIYLHSKRCTCTCTCTCTLCAYTCTYINMYIKAFEALVTYSMFESWSLPCGVLQV